MFLHLGIQSDRVKLQSKSLLKRPTDLRKEATMIELTEQQSSAVAASGDVPQVVMDPKTRTAYVLVRREVYERLKDDYDDSPWTDDEMGLLAAEAGDLLDSFG